MGGRDKKVNLPLVVKQLKHAWEKPIKNSFWEVILADTNIPSPEIIDKDGLSILTIYNVDLSELDLHERALLGIIYKIRFGNRGGEERTEELINILNKINPKVEVKIYVSDHATKLYAEADRQRKKTSREYPVMLIEINRDAEKDVLSSQYFKFLAPNRSKPEFEINKFLGTISPLKGFIRSFYNYEYSLKELVEGNFESSKQQRAKKTKEEDEQFIKSKLKELVTVIPEISNGIEETFRVGDRFWKDPQVLQYRHAMYKEALNDLIDAFVFPDLDYLIELFKEIRSLVQILGSVVSSENKVYAYTIDTISTIIETLEFCESVFDQIKADLNSLLTDTSDSLDVLLAYACGVWNGIVDAIVGIFDSIELIVTIAIEVAFLPQIDFRTGFKEMMMALVKFIQLNREKIIKKIDALEHKASNPRILAYNFGYIVYAVVEMFMPPLKITGALSKGGKLFKPILKVLN